MQDQPQSDDLVLEGKINNILDNNNQFKAWNKFLGIKLLITFPIILFVFGLFILNKPESLFEIFFTLLYPFILIAIGVLLLFLMRRDL